MKALVTGATGFIGSHLVQRLRADGHEVRALVQSTSDTTVLESVDVELTQGDVRDFRSVEAAMAGCEAVFHLAVTRHHHKPNSSGRRPDFRGDPRIIVDGIENVVRAARKNKIARLVHASSVGVHGTQRRFPINEQSPLNPETSYRESRIKAERILNEHVRRCGLPTVIARLTPVYGPRDLNWLPVFRNVAHSGFTLLGKGDQIYHFSYVDDIVAGLIACARSERAVGLTYIIGSEPLPLWRFVTLIAEEVGASVRRLPWLGPPLRGALALHDALGRPMARRLRALERLEFHVRPRHYDLSNARRDLDLPPQVPPREAVRGTVNWYRAGGYL